MKIVLSRKGFDSSVGGCASPILPDGVMLSLPIPTSTDCLSYDDIQSPGGLTFAELIRQLLGDKSPVLSKRAHLDPDLVSGARPRAPGWRGSLGQIRAAAGHLRNQQVGVGDLFLFYGWFRPVESVNGRYEFRSRDAGFHAIYGYLEIGQVLSAPAFAELPPWLRDHPHAMPSRLSEATNTFYVATPLLTSNPSRPGWGTFRFDERLVLSHPAMSRSRWNLERDLFRHLTISYHSSGAWKDGYFQSYPRAQEYVIHADNAAAAWARNLITISQPWGMAGASCDGV